MVHLGKRPPRYRFILNPYEDQRFTSCPRCRGKTRQRKVPLVIHVDPRDPVVLNKTCRYCLNCDLLIAHQDELEAELYLVFAKHKPEVIGNDYLVIGTLDRADWRRGRSTPLSVQEGLDRLHDFEEVLQIKVTGGWGPA
jgi:hypothetical protein